ncbi:hydroxyacid dehydrogenase [Rhodococcus opacus]|uniref:Phosphoglycerate dehydrogenase n=1 Tax=Rhodococcus opacus TaxID=37919 RepID=A0A2S8IT44_RHOOP|nr:hydroxyacid dehydrogenase [Rhodococcus opacus]PQP17954.1 phosphoglycerate dehydrogenase [Rhodococcus opacus]
MSDIDGMIDAVITEDVWGQAFDDLGTSRSILRAPHAWQDREKLLELGSRSRALVVRNRTQVDRQLIEACPSLRVIARAGVGLDNIDLECANEAGVVVVAPLGANAISVAEHTLGMALSAVRRTVELDADCRRGGWQRTPGRELHGGVWGLLGAGATGRACARLARSLGMMIVAYDPFADAEKLAQEGIELVELPALVAARADVMSCHLPATRGTAHLINSELLAVMKPTAVLVNVGRGEVVDEGALADALETGRLGAAALDVREIEPPLPGRLETLDNVILTPHIAGITTHSQDRILAVLADNIAAVLDDRSAIAAVGTHREARS